MLRIQKDIHHCLDKIMCSDIDTQSSTIFLAYLALIGIIETNELSGDELELYFSDPNVARYVERARIFFNKWELHLESIMQAYFIHGKPPAGVDIGFFENIRSYYIEQYRNLVISEIHAASIHQGTRVCHVGVGSMPLSLLMLHKYSKKCFIVGIDCEASAITAARDCVARKCTMEPESYESISLTVQYAEGANFCYAEFDVVILSSSITNKQQIVDQIKRTGNNDLLLIDRKIHGLGHYVYQSSNFSAAGVELSNSEQFGLIRMSCYSLNLTGC